MPRRKFRQTKKVGRWLDAIRKAKSQLGISDDKISDAFVLSIMHIESSGNPGAHRPGSQFYGLFQQGTANAQEIGYPDGSYAMNNGYESIVGMLRWLSIKGKAKIHEYNPQYMAIMWNAGGGTLRKYKRLLKNEGKDSAVAWLATQFDGHPVSYVQKLGDAMRVWGDFTGDGVPQLSEDFTNVSYPTRSLKDTHWGKERAVREMTPFELGSYITPEELRKGIIAQFYYINEWHIVKLAMDEAQDTRDEKDTDQDRQSTPEDLEDANQTVAAYQEEGGNDSNKGIRADNLVDERRRYAQALVEAEFYRRRLASRSIPVVTGPFNPYPVAGFPGLLMTPGRPILGYINNVSHTVNIAAASGSTAVTMTSPRYWDEGEIWYWFGGEPSPDPVMRNFPQWHNREVIPSNNVNPNTKRRPRDDKNNIVPSKLDKFYQFMLNTESIEYLSNHTGVATPEIVTKAIRDRDPGPMEVKEETLDPKEYNVMIASLDDKGRFAPGTLAHKFYGPIRPYDTSEASAAVEDQLDYVERYGVREVELLVDFLGNSYEPAPVGGRLILTGPTFGGGKVNALQNQILEYIQDLDKRKLDGGV